MIFITAADYRFQEMADRWVESVKRWRYGYIVYDLGHLTFGKTGFEVKDRNFLTMGYYNSIGGSWKSTGLHKPQVILDALISQKDNVVYLDADAYLQEPLAVNWEFDIGVVKREHKKHIEFEPASIMLRGDYNAGVIFFKNTDKVRQFVRDWQKDIDNTHADLRNDQASLTITLRKSDLNIKVFPEQYNTKHQKGIIYHCTGGKKDGKLIRQSFV